MSNKKLASKIFTGILIGIFNISFTNFTRSEVYIKKDQSEIQNKNYDLTRDEYLIGPGDILDLNLFDAEDYSGTFQVMSDGKVTFPLIGNIDLNYLTIKNAEEILISHYSKQLLRPELNLVVLKTRPIKVSLVGEIESPGLYTLTNFSNESNIEGTNNSSTGLPTLINAIQKAGGLTQEANLKKIELIRRLPGKEKALKKADLNILELVLSGDQSQNPYLFDGDIIKIKKAKIDDNPEAFNKSNLTNRNIKVTIIGSVNKPGSLEVERGTSLSKGIYLAEGPISWKSNTGQVELVRINKNGSATLRKFKLNLASEISEDKNPTLKNGDIIRVKPNLYSNIGDGIKVIAEPLTNIVTIYSIFKILD